MRREFPTGAGGIMDGEGHAASGAATGDPFQVGGDQTPVPTRTTCQTAVGMRMQVSKLTLRGLRASHCRFPAWVESRRTGWRRTTAV